jgi:hypothetical protein
LLVAAYLIFLMAGVKLTPTWEPCRDQTASVVTYRIDNVDLTMILAKREEAISKDFYEKMEKNLKNKITHIVCAGSRLEIHYPGNRSTHIFSVQKEIKKRDEILEKIWEVSRKCAAAQEVLLIHCNNCFHRGPLAAAALMIKAGYTKEEAFKLISKERIIYKGHSLPYKEWPDKYAKHKHTTAFKDCHAWLEQLASNKQSKTAAASRDGKDDGKVNTALCREGALVFEECAYELEDCN